MTAFNDAEVIRLLKTECIPVANHVRDVKRQDTDGAFFRNICKHIRYWQSGACVFTADGKVLGQCSATSRKEVLGLLKSALPKYKPPEKAVVIEPLENVDKKHRYEVKPLPGTVVVRTMMSHLSERGSAQPWFNKLLPHTVAVDRLWIRKDEASSLLQGVFPKSLKHRIATWHLVNSITFDQNRSGTVKQFDLGLSKGRITGRFRIGGQSHSMELELLGIVEGTGGKLTRFDLVGRGTRKREGAKEGFPVAYGFTIEDGSHVASRIPPYPVLGYSAKLYLKD